MSITTSARMSSKEHNGFDHVNRIFEALKVKELRTPYSDQMPLTSKSRSPTIKAFLVEFRAETREKMQRIEKCVDQKYFSHNRNSYAENHMSRIIFIDELQKLIDRLAFHATAQSKVELEDVRKKFLKFLDSYYDTVLEIGTRVELDFQCHRDHLSYPDTVADFKVVGGVLIWEGLNQESHAPSYPQSDTIVVQDARFVVSRVVAAVSSAMNKLWA